MARLTVKTPPTVEPITLAEAKQHLRVTFTDEDAAIQGYIRAARRNLERVYNRAFITQSLVLGLDLFARSSWLSEPLWGWQPAVWAAGLSVWWSALELRPPVQSITSVTYLDPSGVTQTLASSEYSFDPGAEATPGRIYPALNKTWPAVALVPNAIQIEYVAGFTKPELVPDDWKSAVKLYVGHLYENREQVVVDARVAAIELPMGVQMLMGAYGELLAR